MLQVMFAEQRETATQRDRRTRVKIPTIIPCSLDASLFGHHSKQLLLFDPLSSLQDHVILAGLFLCALTTVSPSHVCHYTATRLRAFVTTCAFKVFKAKAFRPPATLCSLCPSWNLVHIYITKALLHQHASSIKFPSPLNFGVDREPTAPVQVSQGCKCTHAEVEHKKFHNQP